MQVSDYKPGLEGVVAGRTAISLVDFNGRLLYRGYEIADLAGSSSFEEIAYLLWYGDLPTEQDLRRLKEQLASERDLSPSAEATLRAIPPDTHPMDVLRTVISAQGMQHDLVKPDIAQAIGFTARCPVILALFHRQRQGLRPVAPRSDLGHAANYLYMLTGEVPPSSKIEALDAYLVLLGDHGLNASTFAAQIVASTASDLASSLVAAIGALKGPLHGGAPALVLDMLDQIGTIDNVEPWIKSRLERGERLMGFGHRVYRAEDPRARVLREMTRKANPDFFALAQATEEVALRLLKVYHPDRKLYTNVEFYSAGVLHAVGLPRDLFTPTFAVSRVAGWSAHVLEFLQHPRLIRPESEYIGPPPRKPAGVADRGKVPSR